MPPGHLCDGRCAREVRETEPPTESVLPRRRATTDARRDRKARHLSNHLDRFLDVGEPLRRIPVGIRGTGPEMPEEVWSQINQSLCVTGRQACPIEPPPR